MIINLIVVITSQSLHRPNHYVIYFNYIQFYMFIYLGFPGGSVVKSLLVNARESGHGFPSLGREDSLKEEMASQSSILACKIPWTEELGGLQSMGS